MKSKVFYTLCDLINPSIPVYICYLAFQLYSHPKLYEDAGGDTVKTTAYDTPKFRLTHLRKRLADRDLEKARHEEQAGRTSISDAPQSMSPRPEASSPVAEPHNTEEEVEEAEVPQLTVMMSVGLLAFVTVVDLDFLNFFVVLVSVHGCSL